MSDRGIPFSAPMVGALLAGTKTQTRRLINPQPLGRFAPLTSFNHGRMEIAFGPDMKAKDGGPLWWRPLAQPGDQLYVREEYYQYGHWEPVAGRLTKGGRQKWAFVPDHLTVRFEEPPYGYRLGRRSADPATSTWYKRLGRYMPRLASRLTLTVTDVRVERLYDISEEDAIAEGWPHHSTCGKGAPLAEAYPIGWFLNLWDEINGPGAAAKDPWVAAYTFTVARCNIDELGGR